MEMKWSDQNILGVDYLNYIIKICFLGNSLYRIAAVFQNLLLNPLPPKRKQSWISYEVLQIVYTSVMAFAFSLKYPQVQGVDLPSTQALKCAFPQDILQHVLSNFTWSLKLKSV